MVSSRKRSIKSPIKTAAGNVRLFRETVDKNPSLREIRLVESHVNCNDEISFDSLASGEFHVQSMLKHRWGQLEDSFILELKWKFEIEPVADVSPLYKIDVTFLVSYGFKSNENLSDDHVTAFAEQASIINVWPYLREYVQSTVTRMGVPPMTLTLFIASDSITANPNED
jgi:hypothetical protein